MQQLSKGLVEEKPLTFVGNETIQYGTSTPLNALDRLDPGQPRFKRASDTSQFLATFFF